MMFASADQFGTESLAGGVDAFRRVAVALTSSPDSKVGNSIIIRFQNLSRERKKKESRSFPTKHSQHPLVFKLFLKQKPARRAGRRRAGVRKKIGMEDIFVLYR